MAGTVSEKIYQTKDSFMPQGQLLQRPKIAANSLGHPNQLLPQLENLS